MTDMESATDDNAEVVTFLLGVILAASSIAVSADAEAPIPTAKRLDCAVVRGEARPGSYGHDHVVFVRNECDVTIECKVSTNLDRRPRHRLVVPPAEEKGVVTRTNSSRKTFEPKVSCSREAKVSRGDPEA